MSVVDRVGAVVVVESDVKIPYGPSLELVASALLAHIYAPIGVGVATQLAHDEVAQEAVQIEILREVVTIGRSAEYRLLHTIEVVLDVVGLTLGDILIIGRFDRNGNAALRPEVRSLTLSICVDLNQVTTRQCLVGIVARLHLGNIDTSLIHLNLVAELVAATILAVEHHIHGLAEGGIFESYTAADLEGQDVAQQRLVAVVINQCPLLRLGGCAEQFDLLVELKAIGFLGELPAGIASAAHTRLAVGVEVGAILADDIDRAGDLILLRLNLGIACGVDDNEREIGNLV